MIQISAPLRGPGLRGALPTPRHKLLAAIPFLPLLAVPSQFAIVPKQLSMWGNDRYGNCVTAEEAFAKACDNPEDFISDNVVEAWGAKHGVNNGADLGQVMDFFQRDGFVVGPNQYNDGPYHGVDFSKEATLQSALCSGPVKIGIDANALPSGAGSNQGWYALGGRTQYRNEDHCVSLSGFGPAAYLFQQLGVPLPSALASASGYLLFTWSTLGFVDHAWIMDTVGEAWVRTPTTVILGPEPQPLPPGPPAPPPPAPTWWQELVAWVESILAKLFGKSRAEQAEAIPWALVLAAIQMLLKQLGPVAVPLIEAWVAKLPIPGWAITLIDHYIEQYLQRPYKLPLPH